MLRSLFSGITGLRQHQTLMDVVGNNIANVNTVGFKSSSVVFEDTLNQLVKGGSTATTTTGGVNSAQVGLGVQLGTISTNFGQGSAQNTGKATDLMIQGDGFFVLNNAGETVYSRSGAFTFDTNGTMVNPEGLKVQGWMADTTGKVDTNATPTDIVIPTSKTIAPQQSTSVALGGNIPPGTTTNPVMTQEVFDSNGVSHTLRIMVDYTTGAPYQVQACDLNDPSVVDKTATPWAYTYTNVGQYDPTATAPTSPWTASATPLPLYQAPATDKGITFNGAALTFYGGPSSIGIQSADGYASGTLKQFQIGSDGSVLGVFSNDQKLVLAQLGLANFNNPNGLEKLGGSTFRSTTNSGIAQVGAANTGGRGELLGGSLEMSNVDLGREFTNLIVAQRGFQANSRVITTSDQMLQDLVDLKR